MIRTRTPFVHRAIALLSLHAAAVAPEAAAAGAGGAAGAPGDAAGAAAGGAAAGDAGKGAAAGAGAAAAGAAAAKTPEQIKAEQLTAIKGVLKLPENSTIDPAITERTAAILSEQGLNTDSAQKVFGLVTQEVAAHAEKAVTAALQARLPGGTVWEAENTKWKDAALKDADLGNGNPDTLKANVTLGNRVLATFFPKDSIDFLEKSGLLSHPAALKGLVRIGKAMREDQFIQPSGAPAAPKDAADILYPKKG